MAMVLLALSLQPLAARAQDHGAARLRQRPEAKDIGQQVRKALEAGVVSGKQLTVSPSAPSHAVAAAARQSQGQPPVHPRQGRGAGRRQAPWPRR